MRLRHRPDVFQYRGNNFFFHRLQDGPTLARLDPYAEGEQSWLLNSGRSINVTAAEIRDITFQVHGIELPAINPDLKFISDPTLEPRIAALEKLVAELAAKLEAQSQPPSPPPEPATDDTAADDLKAAPEIPSDLFDTDVLPPRLPPLNEKLSAWGEVGDEDFAGIFPAWLDEHAVDGETVSARIARLSAEFKARVNELTNYLLAGTITKEQDDELIEKQSKYNQLAELGDRS